MASFFDEINRNRIKSILLMAIFGGFFAAIIYLIIIILGGGPLAFGVGIAVIALYAIFSYEMGSKIVLKLSGAKKADPKQYPSLYNIVEGLAVANQLKVPEIYIVNDPNPNAFATGKNRNNASIAVTTGLLSMMSKEELEGVLAHELSHIYNNDIQFMLIAVVFAGVIGLVAAFFRGFLFFGNDREGNGIFLLIALAIGILAPIFAMILRLAISRRREYMADANGARITRAPMHLSSALKKIQEYGKNPNATPVRNANGINASLYFANPLSAKSIINLFSTHPPIEERIKRLDKMY
jgi:heat shock protein HtpX